MFILLKGDPSKFSVKFNAILALLSFVNAAYPINPSLFDRSGVNVFSPIHFLFVLRIAPLGPKLFAKA